MAKNWSVSEAVKAINAGDKEAIADIGKRFPQFAVAAAKVNGNEGAMTIFGALPEHVTARKVEAILKDGVDEDTDAETTDEDEEEEEKPKRGRKSAASDDDKKAKAKARREARKAKAKKEEEAEDADEEEEDTEDNSYESMNAIDLYKLCKKRKLDVEPKKKAAYYIDALKAADADTDEEEAEDDWEDEEEEEKPAKKSKGKAAKAKKDDDEDWDI